MTVDFALTIRVNVNCLKIDTEREIDMTRVSDHQSTTQDEKSTASCQCVNVKLWKLYENLRVSYWSLSQRCSQWDWFKWTDENQWR